MMNATPHTSRKAEALKADLDELVFRHRNRTYGAYYLRKHYPDALKRAFLFALIGISVLTAVPLLGNYFAPNDPMRPKNDDTIYVSLPPKERPRLTEGEKKSPPPARVEAVKQPPHIAVLPTRIVHDDKDVNKPATDTTKPLAQAPVNPTLPTSENPLPGTPEGKEGGTPGGTPGSTGTSSTVEQSKNDEPGFGDLFLGVQPKAMNLAAFANSLVFPQPAIDQGLSGKVLVRVLVDEKGHYMKHVIIRSTSPLFTEAVEPKLKLLRFKPGKQGGKAVKVWIQVPLSFNLSER